MLFDTYLQAIGVLSIILTWCAIAFVLLVTARVLEKSVSHHVAMKKNNHIIFAILMTVSLALMSIFLYFWLIPVHSLSAFFAVIVGFAIFLELVATWVPLTVGWRHNVHQVCSYGAAFLLPILMILIILSPGVSSVSIWVSIFSLSLMVILLYLFLFVKPVRRHYLIYQNIYILAFHISILSMIYTV
jgi:hypothetical protein